MLKKMRLFEDNVERRCPSTYIEYIACHVNSFDHCFREIKRKLNYQESRRKLERDRARSEYDYICLLLGFYPCTFNSGVRNLPLWMCI